MVNDFNNIDLINRVYNKYINNKIENATAYSLGNYAKRKLAEEYVKSINDMLKKARVRVNPFNIIESGQLNYGGPTAQSAPRKLPANVQNFILGNNGPLKTGKTVPMVQKASQLNTNRILQIPSQNIKLLTTSGKPLGNIPNVQTAEEVGRLFAKPDSIASRMAKEGLSNASKVAGGINWKNVAGYTPFIGDVLDITKGVQNIKNNRPVLGSVQALLGLGGLATLGTGSLAKTGAKAAIKKMIGEKAVEDFVKELALKRAGVSTGLGIYDILTSGKTKSSTNNSSSSANKEESNSLPPQLESIVDDAKYNVDDLNSQLAKYYSGQPSMFDSVPTQDNYMEGNYEPSTLQAIVAGNQEQPQQNNIDINDLISKYIENINESERPYLDVLRDYTKNMGRYALRDAGLGLMSRGLDSYYGIDVFNKGIGKRGFYDVNTDKLKYDLALQEADKKARERALSIPGNMALLQQAGMSPEAALADPSLLKSLSPVMSSMNALTGKKYAADAGLQKAMIYSQAKEQVAKLNNARALAIAQGTWNTQKEIAYNRDKKNIERAIIQSLGFGVDPAQLLGATNALGYTNITDKQLNTLGNLMGTGDID